MNSSLTDDREVGQHRDRDLLQAWRLVEVLPDLRVAGDLAEQERREAGGERDEHDAEHDLVDQVAQREQRQGAAIPTPTSTAPMSLA